MLMLALIPTLPLHANDDGGWWVRHSLGKFQAPIVGICFLASPEEISYTVKNVFDEINFFHYT